VKIVIIEDEEITARDLAGTILALEPDTTIVAILSSFKESVNFFNNSSEEIDLIFSDIHLGDGTSFDIFSAVPVRVPVIFCTAFDEYALRAFRFNGIDYILKPFDEQMLAKAFQKYRMITQSGKATHFGILQQMISNLDASRIEGQRAIIVYNKDKIMPVKTSNIAFFHLEKTGTYITTFEKKAYFISRSLEEMEKIAGPSFFRANRQFLVNRKAIIEAINSSSRKLTLQLSVPSYEPVLISKKKIAQFLGWLSAG